MDNRPSGGRARFLMDNPAAATRLGQRYALPTGLTTGAPFAHSFDDIGLSIELMLTKAES